MTRSYLLFFALVLAPAIAMADPVITVTTEKPGAVYAVNEPIVWDVKVTQDPQGTIKTTTYDCKEAGAKIIGGGTLTFIDGAATIQTSLGEPGTVLTEVAIPPLNGKMGQRALGGAAVAYDKIGRSAPCPDDFDSFWKSKLDALAAIPPNAVLEKGDSGNSGVDYWKVTLDNINGTHVEGQLARPSGDARCPAMLIVQWAGVYPLDKNWVVGHAAQGWLVLNVMAHDLPIDQPKAFYENHANTDLKNYPAIGATNRDTDYFLRMFLGDIQASKYLQSRPDWNGKTLAVTGTSQGGLQSLVTAALDPAVTAMLVLVPAGADDTGAQAGRKAGWPYNIGANPTPEQKQILDTSPYFDAVNFAARVKCPALIGLGLLDETAPPSGVFAAANQMQGPKELCILPDSDHRGLNNSQAPYQVRAATWFAALAAGQSPPLQSNPMP